MEKFKNKIILGDCLEVMKQIPDKSIDLIVTDPPYLMRERIFKPNAKDSFSIKMKNLFENGLKKYDLTTLDNTLWCEEAIRVMKKINIYIWCNKHQLEMYFDFFCKKHSCKFDILLWLKTNPIPNFKNQWAIDKEYCLYFRKGGYCQPKDAFSARTYWLQPINQFEQQKLGHPTVKHLNQIKQIIENSSRENDIVLDCFLGSGTTAVACHQLKRNFIGIEKNEEFYKIANKRLEEEKKILELF